MIDNGAPSRQRTRLGAHCPRSAPCGRSAYRATCRRGIGSVAIRSSRPATPRRRLRRSAHSGGLLARLELRPVDRATADLATALASKYGLRAADATHLATAVGLGAERFITNNKRDFPQAITEVKVTYPADLADAEVS